MPRAAAVAVLVICLICASCGQTQPVAASEYQPVTKFDPARDAAKDIADAVAEARRTGRHVLLDVGGEWCIWCHKLDAFFEEDPDARQLLDENYVVVKVNFSPENENKEVLSQYPEIAGYPHFFVLDDDGELLRSQNTGDLEEGDHHGKAKMMAFLREWAPK